MANSAPSRGNRAEWFAVIVSLLVLGYTVYSNLRTAELSYYPSTSLLVFADPRFNNSVSLSVRPEFVNTSPTNIAHALVLDQSLRLENEESTACFTYRADANTQLLLSEPQNLASACSSHECVSLPGLVINLSYASHRRTVGGGEVLSTRQIYDRLAFDATSNACGIAAAEAVDSAQWHVATFTELFGGTTTQVHHEVTTGMNGQFSGSCQVNFDAERMRQLADIGWANFACTDPRIQRERGSWTEQSKNFFRRLF